MPSGTAIKVSQVGGGGGITTESTGASGWHLCGKIFHKEGYRGYNIRTSSILGLVVTWSIPLGAQFTAGGRQVCK